LLTNDAASTIDMKNNLKPCKYFQQSLSTNPSRRIGSVDAKLDSEKKIDNKLKFTASGTSANLESRVHLELQLVDENIDGSFFWCQELRLSSIDWVQQSE
jgi:hypothetical protein